MVDTDLPAAVEPSEAESLRALRVGWLGRAPVPYVLTRFVLLRGLGFIYMVAFGVLCAQWQGLVGSRGLLPAARFVEGLNLDGDVLRWPTLFVTNSSDGTLGWYAWLGLLISIAVMLGIENGVVMLVLWAIYLSFCHVGQIFWGYGWEILLLEAGFLAVFLAPAQQLLPLRSPLAPPPPVIWMYRWLVFRVMFGAGLIKLRGDPCWTDLTCLAYHYETQPIPSPISWLLHAAPLGFHQVGVLFNHFVELVVPWGVFGPRKLRYAAGAITIAFQGLLIVSGNLSFLNWLTIVVCLACFDDHALARVLPARLRARARALAAEQRHSRPQLITIAVLCAVVLLLSIGPVVNMLSPRQAMNTSFDPLHLVNSYGAFGSIGRTRNEVIIQGTSASTLGPDTRWVEYELPCKPGDVRRRPCLITPYHYRLDWQMWFAAMSEAQDEPWFIHLMLKLLQGEPAVTRLFAHNPFPNQPPRFVRAELYEYRFTKPGDGSDAYFRRTRVGAYLPPVSREHKGLREYLFEHGLIDEP